jgi:hypothetical protein
MYRRLLHTCETVSQATPPATHPRDHPAQPSEIPSSAQPRGSSGCGIFASSPSRGHSETLPHFATRAAVVRRALGISSVPGVSSDVHQYPWPPKVHICRCAYRAAGLNRPSCLLCNITPFRIASASTSLPAGRERQVIVSHSPRHSKHPRFQTPLAVGFEGLLPNSKVRLKHEALVLDLPCCSSPFASCTR